MSIEPSQTNFTLLQLGPDKKPAEFDGKIQWLKDKPYGKISAKTPWGENYSGLIENSKGYSGYRKGFIRGDQGTAAYSVTFSSKLAKDIEKKSGNLLLLPLQKDMPFVSGVVTGYIYDDDTSSAEKR